MNSNDSISEVLSFFLEEYSSCSLSNWLISFSIKGSFSLFLPSRLYQVILFSFFSSHKANVSVAAFASGKGPVSSRMSLSSFCCISLAIASNSGLLFEDELLLLPHSWLLFVSFWFWVEVPQASPPDWLLLLSLFSFESRLPQALFELSPEPQPLSLFLLSVESIPQPLFDSLFSDSIFISAFSSFFSWISFFSSCVSSFFSSGSISILFSSSFTSGSCISPSCGLGCTSFTFSSSFSGMGIIFSFFRSLSISSFDCSFLGDLFINTLGIKAIFILDLSLSVGSGVNSFFSSWFWFASSVVDILIWLDKLKNLI